jgi:imidazoleglycerol-phosphate dehydratase
MRTAEIARKTAETDVRLRLCLDGTGMADVDTGIGFLDHMLALFARHGRFDLAVRCAGDTGVDGHHSVEDVGICLGRALAEALGDKAGICRFGDVALPMDEALVLAAVDISGRAHLAYGLRPNAGRLGTFETELAEEFFVAFAREAGITLHLRQLDGRNSHHILEAGFKALGRALRSAVAIDPALHGEIPSTKGML